MTEQWRDFDKYKISNYGNVVNSKTGRPIKPHLNDAGYPRVALCINGKRKNYKIARLVATLFIPNPDNLPEVNHKDENKLYSRVDNLEWCDRHYNVHYGTGLDRMIDKIILNKQGYGKS